ncbi:MAG: hypothetical protein ABSG78_05325 [Verrucomicrobiota bacterium]|jgi:hypothetical protein
MKRKRKETGNPTIIFDRSCSVDEMFNVMRAQIVQACKEQGRPVPPLHPCDLISHPGPIAPPFMGEPEPEPKKKRKKKI